MGIQASPMPEAYSEAVELCQIFMSMANKEGASVHVARRGQTMDIGILSFSVLHPDTLLSYNPSGDRRSIFKTMNDNSIVLRLRYGDVTFLFTGEAGTKAEANILEAGLGIQADILKVGHHGSTWASSPQFLKSVMPKVAVYMAPERQPTFGPLKPYPDTITALNKVGAKVYGTETHGTVMITTDGKTYTVDTEKTPVAAVPAEDFEATYCFSGEITLFHKSKELVPVWHFQGNGIIRSNSENKFLDNFTFHSEALSRGWGEQREMTFYSKYLAPNGDIIIAGGHYTGHTGGGKFLEGTGKYRGIAGSFRHQPLARGKPVIPGTLQRCFRIKGTFELPPK